MSDDVGSMLLRAGLVAPDQVEAARIAAREVGGTVPEHLVQQGHIADEDLTSFYRTRLLIPRVNPSDLAKLAGRLLGKVPPDMAAEFRSIPVALDGEGNLTLVMSDPSDTAAVDEIGFFTGNYVVRAVATQAQIAWCLAHYYKQKTKLYLGLVAQGEWPNPPHEDDDDADEVIVADNNRVVAGTITQEVPRQPHPDEGETGPMSVRPRAGKKAKDAELGDESKQETGPTKVVSERPSNQNPSPPELFARAGEIRAAEPEGDYAVAEEGAVVISISPEASAVPEIVDSKHDTAPSRSPRAALTPPSIRSGPA
jgi:hypothetical protein